MKARTLAWAGLISCVLLVSAQAPQDKERIEQLEKKVTELEKRLKATEELVAALNSKLQRMQDKEKVETCVHLISQLDQALESFQTDYEFYPASGNANMVKALTARGPKRPVYFEFTKDMLNEKGEVL